MTDIRCPVCMERVAGEGEMALTHALRDHLADRHGMEDLCMEPGRLYSTATPRSQEGYVGVLCPICGALISAPDGSILSDGLKAHFGDVHGIRSASLLTRLQR